VVCPDGGEPVAIALQRSVSALRAGGTAALSSRFSENTRSANGVNLRFYGGLIHICTLRFDVSSNEV